MNACVVYFSRTGNTKRFAQAIAEIVKAPIYDLVSASPSAIQNCDLLFLGTPVEGSGPAKETVSFIEALPIVASKKAILFCTYRIFGNERTLKKIEKTLEGKGYKTLLRVSKKGMKPEMAIDFSEQLSQVKKVLESLAVD